MKRKVMILAVCVVALALFGCVTKDKEKGRVLVLKSVEHPSAPSPLGSASYLKASGVEMVRYGAYSADNGRTWSNWVPEPDFDSKLPYGYRRGKFPLFVDSDNGRVVCFVRGLDTPGLDPKAWEPPIEKTTAYMRYRVSVDGGKTYLFDDPVMQKDKTPENPFDGIYRNKTGFTIGDGAGDRPVQTRRGTILVPTQIHSLGPDGKSINPGGGHSWGDVVILVGQWVQDNRIEWCRSELITADPARSTRGMLEPTLAEMPDGRILCVMRGSNGGTKDRDCKLPSYRWFAVSKDGGLHWSKPEPMAYEDGTPFFSPSSVAYILKHSSGRYFWIGNLSATNCKGNNPRYPIIIGELDPKKLCMIRNSVLEIDTKRSDESGVNLSHFWCLEDRETKDIVVVGKRFRDKYLDIATSPAVIYRIDVSATH